MSPNSQKWFQSKTLWTALLTIVILLAWGVLQMVHPMTGGTNWLPSVIMGMLASVAIAANKYMASKDMGAPVLSDQPAHILTMVGLCLTAAFTFLRTANIMFPIDVVGSIDVVIGIWVIGDRAKNAIVAPDTPKLPVPVPPVVPPKP